MLSEKQKQFCDYYLTTLNATEAARLAGYASVNPEAMRVKAYRLMREEAIQEYIADKLQHKEEGMIVKQNEILQYLSGCIRGTETEKHITVLRTGNKGAYEDVIVETDLVLKAKDRIRAAEVMAKIYKLMDNYKEKEPVIIIKNTIPRGWYNVRDCA